MEVADNWTNVNFGIRYKWTSFNVIVQRWNGTQFVDLTDDERIKYGFPPQTNMEVKNKDCTHE